MAPLVAANREARIPSASAIRRMVEGQGGAREFGATTASKRNDAFNLLI